jgi:Na+/H+-dicarboxylate symporter
MKNNVLLQVFGSIFLAVIAGLLSGPDLEIFGVTYLQIYTLIGQLFLNALTLVVVPLVASSIIIGTARLGSDGSFGKLGLKTFGYFISTSLLAILVGWALMSLITPGNLQEIPANLVSAAEKTRLIELENASNSNVFETISQILYKLVPSNILAVASQGQMLGLICFSLLFGFFSSRIESQAAAVIQSFWSGIFQIMMNMTQLVMKALPLGVFGLVAKVIATTGLESVKPVGMFFVTVLLGLAIHAFVILPLMLRFIGGVNPLLHFKAIAPALLTAFSTSSTAATLPITIDCVEKRVGVSNRICSFTIPLASSVNLSGSALYVCCVVLFSAQVYGIHLSFVNQCLVVLMTLLTSLGIAGIPSASLISVLMILQTLGLPLEAIGMILAVERLLDMSRAVVNVFGNTCCAVLIARSEGETTDVIKHFKSSLTI